MPQIPLESWLCTDAGWLDLDDGTLLPLDPGTGTMLIGGAMSDDHAYIETYNAECGPLRCMREYDGGSGLPNNILDLSRCAYHYQQQRALAFSFKRDHAMMASGGYDTQIATFLGNWPTGWPGYILIDNEPDQNKKNLDPNVFRAAVEHIVGEFGYQPIPEIKFGIALMNYTFRPSLGPGAGAEWLPNVPELNVDIHHYGRQNHAPLEPDLATLMGHLANRPGWTWGMGEVNAQEKDGLPLSKAEWMTAACDFTFANGGEYWLPFDSGGPISESVRSSQPVIDALKLLAVRYDAGPQGPGV